MKAWINTYARDTFLSWDFLVAFAIGLIAAALGFIDEVRDQAVPVLLSEGATGVAITATVFGAMAIVAAFYDGAYRRALDLAGGGFRSAMMPYVVIGVVAAATAVFGLIAALAFPAIESVDLAAAALAIPSLLCAWTLTGTASLVELTLYHASERARLMGGADRAEHIVSQRRSRRSRSVSAQSNEPERKD